MAVPLKKLDLRYFTNEESGAVAGGSVERWPACGKMLIVFGTLLYLVDVRSPLAVRTGGAAWN